MFPNIKIVEAIRKEYPAGTRIRLVKMDDIQTPPLGTEGTVVGVDDTGSLLMHWDNGSHLKQPPASAGETYRKGGGVYVHCICA